MNLAILPERKPDEYAIQLFMQRLGATHAVASKLAMDHTSLEEIAYVPIEELLETGLDESLLKVLRAKAKHALEQRP